MTIVIQVSLYVGDDGPHVEPSGPNHHPSFIDPSIQLDMYEYDREGLHMYDGPAAGLSLNKLVIPWDLRSKLSPFKIRFIVIHIRQVII